MNRNVIGTLIVSVFILLPTLFVFQNCAGGATSSADFTPSASSDARGTSVSGGFPVDISAFEFSADSSHLVFLAETGAFKNELFITAADGSARRRLSAGGAVEGFRQRPDGVLYLGEENAGVKQLFFTDLNGGAHVNVGGALPAGTQVESFEVHGDAVIFLADVEVPGRPELYATDFADLGQRRKLSTGSAVLDFQVYDGYLLFRAGVRDLYAVDYDGGGLVKVSQASGVLKYEASGSRIVYSGDFETPGRPELYFAKRDGSARAKVSPTLTLGGQVVDFALTATGENVIYLADAESRGQRELFQRDLVSFSAPIKLNPPLTKGGNVTRFTPFTRMRMVNGAPVRIPGVAFVADAAQDDRFELFATTDLAQVGQRVNGPMNPNGDVIEFAVSADGGAIAYVADQELDGHFELYRKSFDAADAVKLVAGDRDQDVLPPLGFHADGRVFFVADMDLALQRQLYVTDANGRVKRVARAGIAESDVYEYRVSPDGKWIAYAGAQETLDRDELFVAPMPAP